MHRLQSATEAHDMAVRLSQNWQENNNNKFLDVLFVVAQAGYALETVNAAYLCVATREETTYWSALVKIPCHMHVYTPLTAAIEAESLERVNWLLDRGADINYYTPIRMANMSLNEIKSNMSPLVRAIHKENVEIVRLLIRRGADIHYYTYWSAIMHDFSMILSSSKSIRHFAIATAVYAAVDDNLFKIVKELLRQEFQAARQGCRRKTPQNTPYHYKGLEMIETVKILVNNEV